MKAVILVGGEGTRLRPLTYHTPKQMLPIVGTPMLERVLGNLVQHGVTDAVLSMGYLPDHFKAAYPENIIAGVRVTYAVEPEPLDTGGAIRFAARHADVDDTFLVVNGDVITDLDVSSLVAFHRKKKAHATLALHPVEDPSRFGVVATNADGRVTAFVEKPKREEAPSNEISAGTYVFEPSVLEYIEADRRVSVERVTFPALVSEGLLFALADSAYWLDTGTPESFLRANIDVLSGVRSLPLQPPLRDGSWIHQESQVHPTSTVVQSVIDRRCIIGPGARVQNAVLLPGAVVEENAVVEYSILGPEAVVESGARLGPTCVVAGGERVLQGAVHSGDVRIGRE
jgi:mannose-1-phosphate guanylyltransferase